VSAPAGALLVLGVGNVLMRDEGIGVHVVRAVTRDGAPIGDDVVVVDGGTLGLDLLPLIDDARALVLIDAVELHAEPGTVRVLRGDAVLGVLGGHLSAHQVGLGDLVAVGRLTGALPEQVVLVGIQPAAIEVGVELTSACAAAVPRAVEAVCEELAVLRAPAAAVAWSS
jgi:hydrogenase maturation protease